MSNRFKEDLKNLIRERGIDCNLKCPDFILAAYLCDSLDSLKALVEDRDDWYELMNKHVNKEGGIPVNKNKTE